MCLISNVFQNSGRGDSTKQSLWQKIKARLPFTSGDPEALLGEGLAKQVGNVTECAMLGFLVELGVYQCVCVYM